MINIDGKFEFNNFIIHGLPKCKKCNDKSCNIKSEIEAYAKTLRNKFHVKVTVTYTENFMIFYGYIGKIEDAATFWVECTIDTGHRFIFIPPMDSGYVCTELPDEHSKSYL